MAARAEAKRVNKGSYSDQMSSPITYGMKRFQTNPRRPNDAELFDTLTTPPEGFTDTSRFAPPRVQL